MSITKLRKKLEVLVPTVMTVSRQIKLKVWQLDLSGYFDNQDLKNKILKFREQFPKSNKSNVTAWHSSYLTHHITDDFDHFISKIKEVYVSCINEESQYYSYEIDNFWAGIYEKGDFTKAHTHGDYSYAFVYYVDADEGASPLILESNLVIKPRPSLLVLFSGQTIHSVPKIINNSNRIILSGNILRVSRGFKKEKIVKEDLDKILSKIDK